MKPNNERLLDVLIITVGAQVTAVAGMVALAPLSTPLSLLTPIAVFLATAFAAGSESGRPARVKGLMSGKLLEFPVPGDETSGAKRRKAG